MNAKTKALAAAAVAAVLLATAFAMMLPHDSRDGEEIEGYWYQLAYSGYRDGEYTANGDGNNPSTFDISISACHDGVFCGTYLGTDLSGTYSHGIMEFYGTYGGIKTFHYATFADGIMYAAVIEQKADGTVNVFMNIYCQEAGRTVYDIPETAELAPVWQAYKAEFMSDGGEITSLIGTRVLIEKQEGHIFGGTMEQMVDGKIVGLSMYGVLTACVEDGLTLGYVVVAGEMWAVITDGSTVFRLRTGMIDTSGVDGTLVTVNRSYSTDGEAVGETFPDLEGTSWAGSGLTVAAGGEIAGSVSEYEITVAVQCNALFYAELTVGGAEYHVLGYIYGDNFEFSFARGETYVYGAGHLLADGSLYFNEWSPDGSAACGTMSAVR